VLPSSEILLLVHHAHSLSDCHLEWTCLVCLDDVEDVISCIYILNVLLVATTSSYVSLIDRSSQRPTPSRTKHIELSAGYAREAQLDTPT